MSMSKYEIIGLISDRGPTRIYHAIDQSNQQHVALRKVDITNDLSRSDLDQLVQQSECLKANPHPHLANVLEVIRELNELVIVYQWIDGQTLRQKVNSGISLDETVALLQTVYTALQYLDKIGVIHGQVSPGNVLIDEQNHVTLINVSTFITTPSNYRMSTEMKGLTSPELSKGGSPSRDSDVYSLGIILFRILCGDYPWKTKEGNPRTRSKKDVVPSLPEGLQDFQPVVEGFITYEPSLRCLDEKMLETLPKGAMSLNYSLVRQTFRPANISIDEVHSVSPIKENVPIRRPTDRSLLSQRAKTIGFVGLSCLLVSAALWWIYTERDSVQVLLSQIGITEHPEFAERWRDAEALRADVNQSLSAVIAAYNRVLELSPNHQGVRQAINDTRTDWKTQMSTAIEKDQLSLAQARINEYLAQYPNDNEVLVMLQQVDRRLRIDRLFDDTRILTTAGIDDQASAIRAIDSYKEIQSRDPESQEAQIASSELQLIVEEWLTRANVALQYNDVPFAREALAIVARADPTSRELEIARNKVTSAESLQEEINATLLLAEQHSSSGNLIEPRQDNAYSIYRRVLELDPENDEATLAMEKIETQILVQHGTLLQDREFELAVRLVSIAEQESLSMDTLELMRSNHDKTANQIVLAEQRYTEALVQYEQGYLTKPRNRSAMSLLLEAQELDAKNLKVRELIILCADRLASVALAAQQAGMTPEAVEYIDYALLLQPEQTLWQDYRASWSDTITVKAD